MIKFSLSEFKTDWLSCSFSLKLLPLLTKTCKNDRVLIYTFFVFLDSRFTSIFFTQIKSPLQSFDHLSLKETTPIALTSYPQRCLRKCKYISVYKHVKLNNNFVTIIRSMFSLLVYLYKRSDVLKYYSHNL